MTTAKTKQSAVQPAASEATTLSTRTVEVIAAEIRTIDQQARQAALQGAIQIGLRLTEAKALVGHGEWGDWLKANVNYSQSTANNFMRVATEYEASGQALANLSYTQAVALLAVPAEEREEFVEQNQASEMSSRELQAAIKAKQEAEKALKEKEEQLAAEQLARQEEEGMRSALYAKYEEEQELRKRQEEQIRELEQQSQQAQTSGDDKALKQLKADLRKAEKAASASEKRIADLQAELDQKAQDGQTEAEVKIAAEVERIKAELVEQARKREDEVAKQLADVQEQLRKNNNVAGIKIKMHFEAMLADAQLLLQSLGELENPEQKEAMKARIGQTLDDLRSQF
ncbi:MULTISPECIES: DUF3102 domain-containing protein [unclassified Paenibacillus]|uniref:DUF3102 domain-containing protein n=1 Tax=unclassified Paenibacillus TaxID=185978 RepID=UPI0009559942|nr:MULTISPECIES: DUF3102 domain-containing protein [unclassified Paenibacillus]ASS66393.1 DUF3102 domain-containing protein [Paenibacillus sp. RUD330]SIQ05763.1 Protein of unknown function [Paenibacillus sp. RU4X]SIQ25910.1 Protein of unknown function [Paenibacillus sp. RU4T]